jgi:hypothetical protein
MLITFVAGIIGAVAFGFSSSLILKKRDLA